MSFEKVGFLDENSIRLDMNRFEVDHFARGNGKSCVDTSLKEASRVAIRWPTLRLHRILFAAFVAQVRACNPKLGESADESICHDFLRTGEANAWRTVHKDKET